MKQHFFLQCLLFLLLHQPSLPKSIIAVLGSSVAKGHGCSGNCSGNSMTSSNNGNGGCYQTKLKRYQQDATHGIIETRKVLNSAVNGDNTARALVRLPGLLQWISTESSASPSTSPNYVLVGLSLANQGYNGDTYRTGLQEIITLCQANNVVPIIGLCYANGWKGASGYALTKQMNVEIQTQWNISSINFLGGVDDGSGGWATGYWNDAGHPNDLGQIEMYYTIVPSLFDALALGKMYPRPRQRNDGVVRSTFTATGTNHTNEGEGGTGGIYFQVKAEERMHSFSIVFEMQSGGGSGSSGVLMNVIGLLDDTDGESKTHRRLSLDANNGRLIYESSTVLLQSDVAHVLSAGSSEDWHMVALVHHWARRATNLYLDGVLISGQVQEQLAPVYFSMGMADDALANDVAGVAFRDLLIYRAGLNSDEVHFLWQNNKLVTGSLEIYSPLDQHNVLLNLAQSVSEIQRNESGGGNGGSGNGSENGGSGNGGSGNGGSGNGGSGNGGNGNEGNGNEGSGNGGNGNEGNGNEGNNPIPDDRAPSPSSSTTSKTAKGNDTSDTKHNGGTTDDTKDKNGVANGKESMDEKKEDKNGENDGQDNLGISILVGVLCGMALGLCGVAFVLLFDNRKNNRKNRRHSAHTELPPSRIEMQNNPGLASNAKWKRNSLHTGT
jgi:hypothetical protein